MSKPYDAGTKFLIEHYLADWLALSERRSSSPTAIIDADLSTVTAAADKVLRVDDPQPWLLHLELQASRDEGFVERVQWYNGLLEYRHKLNVHSQEADAPELSGLWQRGFSNSRLTGFSAIRWFAYGNCRWRRCSTRDLGCCPWRRSRIKRWDGSPR